jgi:hypothetical protein
MSFTFPIDIPSSLQFQQFNMGLNNVVAVGRSEFSGAQQVQVHDGEWWEFDASLSLINRDDSEKFQAFVTKLGGQEGTFLTAIPGAQEPRGPASGTPVVDGGSQTGFTLDVRGFNANVTGIMLAGDYFQLGTGADTHLHKLVEDADSDNSGNATLKFRPALRVSPADGDSVITDSPQGLFRLKSNRVPAQLSEGPQVSMSFGAIEAI